MVMGFSGATFGAPERPIFLVAELPSSGFRGPRRSDLAQRSHEGFHFLLRADGDAKEVAHRWEAAADQYLASRELIDDGTNVGVHGDHYEICLRRDVRLAVLGKLVAEPSARAVIFFAARVDVSGIAEAC